MLMMMGSLVPLFAAALLGQDVQFTREGPYWKRTENGDMPAMPARVLKVTTRGHVVVRGGAGEQITYRLIEQVRARSEEEAHRLFGSGVITISAVNGVATLVVAPFAGVSVIRRLEVNVPRRV